jgi:Clathrin adaptor complex small chain
VTAHQLLACNGTGENCSCCFHLVVFLSQVYAILDEYIVAGELQETSQAVILDRLKELEKMMM